MGDMDQWFIAVVLNFTKEDQVIGFENALSRVDAFVEIKDLD